MVLICISLIINDIEHLSVSSFDTCLFYLAKSVQITCPYLKYLCCFFIGSWNFFIYSGYKTFTRCMTCKYFLQVCGLAYHSLNSIFLKSRSLLIWMKFSLPIYYTFGVTSKKFFSHPNSQRRSLLYLLFSKFDSFRFLHLDLCSILSEILCLAQGRIQVQFLECGHPIIPASFVEKPILSPQKCFCTL